MENGRKDGKRCRNRPAVRNVLNTSHKQSCVKDPAKHL